MSQMKHCDDIDFVIPEIRVPVVQDDGCKYGGFVFSTSEDGKSWALSWTKEFPDGTWTTEGLYMNGTPGNIVGYTKNEEESR